MTDQADPTWPREIWMAELDEHHNGTGMIVLSEFATVPRWEGDDERDGDFHRYVDADILETTEQYYKNQIEGERQARQLAENCLRQKDATMTTLFRMLDEHDVDYSHLIS